MEIDGDFNPFENWLVLITGLSDNYYLAAVNDYEVGYFFYFGYNSCWVVLVGTRSDYVCGFLESIIYFELKF